MTTGTKIVLTKCKLASRTEKFINVCWKKKINTAKERETFANRVIESTPAHKSADACCKVTLGCPQGPEPESETGKRSRRGRRKPKLLPEAAGKTREDEKGGGLPGDTAGPSADTRWLLAPPRTVRKPGRRCRRPPGPRAGVHGALLPCASGCRRPRRITNKHGIASLGTLAADSKPACFQYLMFRLPWP